MRGDWEEEIWKKMNRKVWDQLECEGLYNA